MSIINEALKKTGQYIQKNSLKKDVPVNIKPGPRPILLYILILLAGLFLGNIIFILLRYKVKPANIPEKAIPINQQPVAPPSLPATATLSSEEKEIPVSNLPSNKQTFVLNGIFFSDNYGYALINNQIVRENDLVDGAKVQKITANSVELKHEDKIITLTTPR